MENILRYYLMPHPPLIIPEVGRGQEKVIQKMLSDDFSEFVFFKNRFGVAKRAIIALKKITA